MTILTIIYILCALFAAAVVALGIMLTFSRRRERALESELREKTDALTRLTAENARLQAQTETLEAQGKRDKEELSKLQESFRLEFRNLANDILEQKSAQFKQTNKESLDALLKPFRENITQFRERVETIYSDENRQRGALQNEIKNLMDLNRRITEETTNLTRALKGDSKVQGDWGEAVLETILERSNLTKGIHYTKQTNLKDAAGNNIRPDFILNMPDGKRLVIDSKVSLTAYVNYTAAEDEDGRRKCLSDHVRSVRSHVNELGRVGYQQNVLGSPDFVIMFMPTESAFLAAMQADTDIWNEAYSKQVIVSSPANLTAILMVVHDLWKRDEQNRNSVEIAEAGANLYDKFVGFVETLENVGKGIGNAQASYEKAMGQLRTGSGNLIGRTEKLRKLGVKASKALSSKIVEDAGEDE